MAWLDYQNQSSWEAVQPFLWLAKQAPYIRGAGQGHWIAGVSFREDKMWVQVFICVSSASVALAAYTAQCTDHKVKENFDLDKITGPWYLIETSVVYPKFTKKCTFYLATKLEADRLRAHHEYVKSTDGKRYSEDIDVVATKEPGKLIIAPETTKALIQGDWDLWVIETDYDNYLITYTCRKHMTGFNEEVNIVSRKPTMSAETLADLHDKITKRGYDIKRLKLEDQSHELCKTTS